VARKHPAGDLRRPPTSCAHRLRKPDRTCELLALSVARCAQDRGLRPTSPDKASKLRRIPFGTPRPDTIHRARTTVAAVGLERRPPDGPERLPSDRLEPRGPSGLCSARCSRAPLAPHPVARCEPGPASSKAGWSPRATSRSGAPPFDGHESDEKDASHRDLQPTPFTSTPRTVRFLVAPRCHAPPRGVSWHPSRVLRRKRGERWLTLGLSQAGGEAREPAICLAG